MLEKTEYYSNVRMAVTFNQDKRVQELLSDKRFNLEREGAEIILVASKRGYITTVKLLLEEERVNPAADNDAAFIEACKNGRLEIVELLLKDFRINPVTDNAVALREACKNTHFETVNLLLNDSRFNLAIVNQVLIEESFKLLESQQSRDERYFVDRLFFELYSKLCPQELHKQNFLNAMYYGNSDIIQLLFTSNVDLNFVIALAIGSMQEASLEIEKIKTISMRCSKNRVLSLLDFTAKMIDFVMFLYKHIKNSPILSQETIDKAKNTILRGDNHEMVERLISIESYDVSEKYKSHLCFFHFNPDIGAPTNIMNQDISGKIFSEFVHVLTPKVSLSY